MNGGKVRALVYVVAVGIIAAAVLMHSDLAGAVEKLVDRDGKVLYYLHEDGRVSYPNGKTAGYMRGHGFVEPDGKPTVEWRDSQQDHYGGKESKAKERP